MAGVSPLHPKLAHWERNVGEAVVLDLAPPAPPNPGGVDVLSWNLGIGTARLQEVLDGLRAGRWGPGGHPLVILAQEAFRAGESVPAVATGRFHGGLAPRGGQAGITDFAERNGLSLRYVASMRNGAHASDRGNAVLADVALGAWDGWVLPFARQRRVAVAAELAGFPGLRFASAHLDVGRGGAPGRMAQAAALGRHLADCGDAVLGADLNTPFGTSDPAYQALIRTGLAPAVRVGGWRHTFHGPIFLRLDHVLFRSPTGRIGSVEVVRLDENSRDFGARVFGSDHHPLLARVVLDAG